MTRTSIAELTLKKQIEHNYARMTQLDHEISLMAAQRAVYQQSITDLETEQLRLRTQRESASARGKTQAQGAAP